MTKLSKILLGFFILLLVLVLGEVGYYFYYQPKTNSAVNVKNVPFPSPILTISPTNILIPSASVTNAAKDNSQSDRAINDSVIFDLKKIKKGLISSSNIINQFQGTISALNVKGGVDKNQKYAMRLKIVGENGLSNGFILNDYEFAKVRITKLESNGKTSPLSLDALRINDKIKIQQVMDLLKSSGENTVEFIIVKL